jgi:phosphotransferase system HPr-like phosphotransfer protein
MSFTGLLKQAQLADKVGNYKLADILTNRLIKIAKTTPAKIFLDALDLKKVVVDAASGAKKTIAQVAQKSTSDLILLYSKPGGKDEAIKIIDELALSARDKNTLIRRLNSSDSEKAIEQLNKIFTAKYQAMADAGYNVKPKPETKLDEPKPETKLEPKPDESTVKTRLDEITKTFKGDKDELVAELKKLGFTDDEIRAAGIIKADGGLNIVNVNKLINNASAERIVELNASTINFGGTATSLSGMPYAVLADLLRRTDINPADQTKIINKIKIQLRKDPNLVVDADLRRYFDIEFHSPRPPKPDAPKPDAPKPDAPTTPGSTADEIAEGASNTGKKPKDWKAWAMLLGIPALAALGWTVYNGVIVNKNTGQPISDEEGKAAMNRAGAGTGAGTGKFDSKMYDDRMKTTPNQQMMKGNKPQEFVNANKDKYKTQREFYNAALAAGDENFANSVIALVKKDMSLDIEK